MLVALGFLTAAFIVLLTIPLYRRRAERLAVEAVKASLPMSEAEIRADKDRLRAEYAIRIHQLETKVDEAGHQSARQRIDLNRRDGRINALEAELSSLRISIDEHENARRVLEQTITDRLPKVEQRLAEARNLLVDRDREIERLKAGADETSRALDEARQINMQQRDEVHRLNATLAARQARNREVLADPVFDAEVALRAEIESLRARSREQADTIARLQRAAARKEQEVAAAVSSSAASDADRTEEIERLRASLAEAEIGLKAAQSGTDAENAAQKAMQREIETLTARNRQLVAEVESLKASLKSFEAAVASAPDESESRATLKARIASFEQTAQAQTVTVQGLRAELAAANERMARQASYFREELKRLGTGTVPTTGEARHRGMNRGEAMEMAQRRRQTLAERIGAPRPASVARPDQAATADEAARSAPFLKALAGDTAAPQVEDVAVAVGGSGSGDVPGGDAPRRRASLLERISGAGKPSGN